MKYYSSKIIEADFESTIQKVTEELKKIGFGVLTTIDVKKTLKEKIDADFKPYTILGACNPNFANQALRMEDKLGALLPCNVVVIDQGNGKIEVAAMDAQGMIGSIGNTELEGIAKEVGNRMEAMIEAL